jgi:hypothetical protein
MAPMMAFRPFSHADREVSAGLSANSQVNLISARWHAQIVRHIKD